VEDFIDQKIKGIFCGGHLGSHDLEIGSQGHVKMLFEGLMVTLNNQEVFWAQNHPEN
jgi:hypothetical protein